MISLPFLLNLMTALTWAARLILFFFLVLFATQNTDPVILHFMLDQSWQAPLVIVLLAFFIGGAILGVLSLLGVIYRQRREISRLKRAVEKSRPVDAPDAPPAI